MFNRDYFSNLLENMNSIPRTGRTIPIVFFDGVVNEQKFLTEVEINFLKQTGFNGLAGDQAFLASSTGDISKIVLGYKSADGCEVERFLLGSIISRLPKFHYKLNYVPKTINIEELFMGYLFSNYQFSYKTEYNNNRNQPVGLEFTKLNKKACEDVKNFAESESIARDLINTPASSLGPNKFEEAVQKFALHHGLSFTSIIGEKLTDLNFPLIHAVGRAAQEAPRLLELSWGDQKSKKVTLVGKGVCFDTGGLNIKLSKMNTMKKDMAGAAHILSLAHLIIKAGINLNLRVLIPIVENSVSDRSFRPSDILTSRKGLTIEVNNTDAEGRLILADTLAFATEEKPDLLISMATLTGAARVALGPDIAPFFSNNKEFGLLIKEGGISKFDPVWELPFYQPYQKMINSDIADLNNAPFGSFGGALTAALFLKRFVPDSINFTHFDIYGWSVDNKPGRPKGAVSQGVRATYYAVKKYIETRIS